MSTKLKCLIFSNGNRTEWSPIRSVIKRVGAFPSTKISEIFETGANGTEISRERSQKIRKFLNFRKANHSTQNSGNSTMKIKWNGNFQENMFENLGIPREVVFFFVFFRKLCKFSIFYSALVLLATITASWASHARMTTTRIRKWKYFRIIPLICR